jgi:hypothetical protein
MVERRSAALPATPLAIARAVRSGLANMKIQAYLTAAAINLKRLAAAAFVLFARWMAHWPAGETAFADRHYDSGKDVQRRKWRHAPGRMWRLPLVGSMPRGST